MTEAADFFVAGGTLRPDDPSYVTRPADHDLLQQLQAGEFCYVLTPRQMGKSSLMVRTAQRLREDGTRVAIVDLTSIGTGSSELSPDQWYLGLLSRIRTQLRLATDVQRWWDEHGTLGISQRFTTFLHDVLLVECSEPVVILIDEIDSTLNLNFRDDFFAAIRAVYNERATDPTYQRLTFALFGVATPTDLIQDRERTPFNIGRRIDLREFTLNDAQPLRDGLAASFSNRVDAILKWIFYWTNGHPYLTQKLCHVLQTEGLVDVNDAVQRIFLSDEGRKDPNLTFVQDRVANSPEQEKRRMLQLYRRVQRGDWIADDNRSPVQNRLELYGLVGVAQGQLQVRNRIYERVFDGTWITSMMPVDRRQRRAVLSSIAMIVLSASVILWITLQPTVECSTYQERFINSEASDVRLSALANLFDQGCRSVALDLFYAMDSGEHEALFLHLQEYAPFKEQLKSVIEGVYRTLDTVPEHDMALMDIWLIALQNSELAADDSLVFSIQQWEKARQLYDAKNYAGAVAALRKVQVQDHSPIHLDLAYALIAQQNYTDTLTELDKIIGITERTIPTPTPALNVTSSATITPRLATKETVQPIVILPTGFITSTVDANVPNTSLNRNKYYTESDYQRRFDDKDKILSLIRQLIEGNKDLSNYLSAHTNGYPQLSIELGYVVSPIAANPTVAKDIAVDANQEAISYPLKTNALDIWIASVQNYFNQTGQISDNLAAMERRDIPNGVTCDVASVDGGWSLMRNEEWQLLCTMDGFRTTRSLRLNGTAARGLTGGSYYATDNPFTVYGNGLWPEGAYDGNQEVISYPLKTNAIDIWIANIQNRFNKTGQIGDNIELMDRRDIPNGVTCDLASVNGGWDFKQYEEWQLLCSMDDFRTTRSLRLNGTAARGLTGGGYYATDNPFTVYGDGLWPNVAYDISKPTLSIVPITPTPAIYTDVTKFTRPEFLSIKLKLNAIDIWLASIQNRFNKTGQIIDNTEAMERRDIPSGVTCHVASVDGGWSLMRNEEWQVFCSMDGFRTTRSLRLNGTATRGLTGGGYYSPDNPFTVYGDGLWPDSAYDLPFWLNRISCGTGRN